MSRSPLSRTVVLAASLALAACGGEAGGIVGTGGDDAPPSFLLQGWISWLAENQVTTYDFTQAQAAGRRTVEIRAWQRIGTLEWQSHQTFTADFTAGETRISMNSPAGYREVWQIVGRDAGSIVVQSSATGRQFRWYNCSAEAWPQLIYLSTRGCTTR